MTKTPKDEHWLRKHIMKTVYETYFVQKHSKLLCKAAKQIRKKPRIEVQLFLQLQ